MNDIRMIKACRFSESRIENFKIALVMAYLKTRWYTDITRYDDLLKRMINEQEFKCYIFYRNEFLAVREVIKELYESDYSRKFYPIDSLVDNLIRNWRYMEPPKRERIEELENNA